MAGLTSRGYPYPGVDDDNNGPGQMQTLAEKINDDVATVAAALAAATADTGWIAITNLAALVTPDSAAPQVRQIGNRVQVEGGITDAAFVTSTFQTLFTLPSGITLTKRTREFPIAGPNARMARLLPTGEVQFTAAAASSITFPLESISYLTD